MPHRIASAPLRGVNLGGWLVLEKWMTPSLFAGMAAEDETRWCVELADQAGPRLRQHWRNFITRDDFAWLAAIGINAVRIPVGYWLLAPDYPYHASFGASRYPFVSGGQFILDDAFDWAEQYGLKVVLDLHAAPGCQNGFDNGGLKDICEWHTNEEHLEYCWQFLEALAQRYHRRRSLCAIEVLNEPRWDIESALLRRYTEEAYRRIRRYCRAADVAVVFHDAFRSYREYRGLLSAARDENIIFDIHRYQCFEQQDVETDIYGHVVKSVVDWKNEADELIGLSGRKTIVGEWSLGLNPRMLTLWSEQLGDHGPAPMSPFQQHVAYRAYAAAQLACFEKYHGWFFWSYKTEDMLHWSFRDCVEQGWLPAKFA